MCLSLEFIIIPQFPFHMVDVLLQVAVVNVSCRFQILLGLCDFLYKRFPLGHRHASKNEKSHTGVRPRGSLDSVLLSVSYHKGSHDIQ